MKLIIANKNYSSWSLRPWLVLTHFDIAFDEETALLNGEGWKAHLNKISPTGAVPVLVDGDLVIAESLAIIEYMADRHPEKAIWPADMADRARARFMACEMHGGFFGLRNAAPMNLRAFHPGRVNPADIATDLKRIETIWSDALARSGGPFLFGGFCAADAMFAPVVTRLKTYDIEVSDTSRAYMAAMHDLPAMAAWRTEALKETWVVDMDEIDTIQRAKSPP
ncbi:MAG: glutathione S-transferase family protein [Alphaproteobacteria bacterium]|nr:glutathione S-transferase family protein [Alphaproteobacteria bacterium]